MSNTFTYRTERLSMRILDESSAPVVLDYYIRNRNFHQPWFSARTDAAFTLEHQRRHLAEDHAAFLAGRSLPFYLFRKGQRNCVIGRVAFSNIIRGAFQSCFLGYNLSEDAVGQGYAFEAIQAGLKIVFDDFKLHRVEANIMPHNVRSISLARRLGFQLEGISRHYLEINGRWEDHLHYVKLNEEPLCVASDYPMLTSDRLIIRQIEESDIPTLIQYYERNQSYLSQYNPMILGDCFSSAHWQREIALARQHFENIERIDFGIFLRDKPSHLIGMIDFCNITPLPYSACELGYSVDKLMAGRGIMFEALMVALHYVFEGFGINRVYARVHPENEQSNRLLQFLGFKDEGIMRQGVYMHDSFQDLQMMSLLHEDFQRI